MYNTWLYGGYSYGSVYGGYSYGNVWRLQLWQCRAATNTAVVMTAGAGQAMRQNVVENVLLELLEPMCVFKPKSA